MNNITIYKNDQFGEIRTMERDGEIWFVGKDVAEVLGYSNHKKALKDHVDAEDSLRERIVTSGQNREMIIINESGLYSLILSSKLPQTKEFKRWVTSEILPSVRKHGGYIAGQEEMSGEELMARAILFADRKIKEQAERIALMEPKAAYYDTVTESAGSLSFRETAKVLAVREKEFIAFLEKKKLVFRNGYGKLVPYAKYQHDRHWFEVNEITITRNGERRPGHRRRSRLSGGRRSTH